jgi:hypothetical protein
MGLDFCPIRHYRQLLQFSCGFLNDFFDISFCISILANHALF